VSEWIDITRPVDETLVTWPGRSRPARRWEKSLAAGDHCNVSSWEWNAHSGTHVDAPLHFMEKGLSIDQIPPDIFLGECRVVELAPDNFSPLDEKDARRYAGAKRLLVKTGHSRPSSERLYGAHEMLMTENAAALLLESGLTLVGTDRLSVDDSKGRSFGLHHLFLGAGCVIVEGLLLTDIREGAYDLSALPLRLGGAEASPIRALLKPEHK
jgi:arylformamidase